MSKKIGHIVIGFTRNSKIFRPSDWAERVASVCGLFDVNCRLHYNPMLRPITHNDLSGLYIAHELEKLNPDAYHFAMDFAHRNQLQILKLGTTEVLHEVA